jgi:hypothetical protein
MNTDWGNSSLASAKVSPSTLSILLKASSAGPGVTGMSAKIAITERI